jgi:hypothetical protein
LCAIAADPLLGPIQIGAIAVRKKNAARQGEARHGGQYGPLYGGSIRGRHVTVPYRQLERAGVGVIEVESRNVPEPYEGLKEKVDARADFRLRGIAGFPGFLDLEGEPDIGMESGEDIDVRQKLECLGTGRRAKQPEKKHEE